MLLLAVAVAVAAPEPLLLDAGPLAGPVLEGFAALHRDGSDDPRARWLNPPLDAVLDDGPDPLAADALLGGVLHLDLPPGRWRLAAMLGRPDEHPATWAVDRFGLRVDGRDALVVEPPAAWPAWLASPTYAASPRPVFRPGETAWHRQHGPAHPWHEVDVVVDADGIDVAAFGRPLQALVAWPGSVVEGWEIRRIVVDGARAPWWRDHVAGRPAPSDAPPAAAPGPLAVTVTDLGGRQPGLGTAKASATLHLARGDRSARLVLVSGGDAPGTVTVDAPPGVEVDVAEAIWLDASQAATRRFQPRPTVLEPGLAWRGGQGVPPALAVTVRTPPDARPGRRRVRLTLARGAERAVVDLDVHVHDVVVGRTPSAGLFVQVDPAVTLRTGFASPEVLAVLDDHLALLAGHGLDALSIRYAFWPDRWPDDATVDSRVFDHVATRWAALGGTSLVWADPKVRWRPAAYVGVGPVLPDDLHAPVAAMLDVARRAPLPTYVHAWEEEASWKRLDVPPRGHALMAALRTLGAERLFATIPGPPDEGIATSVDRVVVGGEGRALVEVLARVRPSGAEVWAYNLAPGASAPLLAWAVGVDGLLQWHAGPVAGDPFLAAATPGHVFHTLLAPDGRVKGTVLLADLADGLADARLLATLADDPDARPIVEAARAALVDAASLDGGDGDLLSPTARSTIRAALLRGR